MGYVSLSFHNAITDQQNTKTIGSLTSRTESLAVQMESLALLAAVVSTMIAVP